MLGPLDQRKRRTRCEACTRRRVKCQGGFPCQICVRNRRTCVPPLTNGDSSVVFVNSSLAPSALLSTALTKPDIPINMRLDDSTQYTHYFFSDFLRTYDFTGRGIVDLGGILSLYHQFPSLRQAALAVAALDASKRSSLVSCTMQNSVRIKSLNAYRSALVSLQSDLEANRLQTSDACLWSSFFLGIFELMYDASGEGFVKHILYGMSQMLQLRGPAMHVAGPGRSFFVTARAFEICRAVVYNQPTFLSNQDWMDMMTKMWQDKSVDDWHPKESLYDLMISCISLSCRAQELDDRCVEYPLATYSSHLVDLVNDGLDLQKLLFVWYAEFETWTSQASPDIKNVGISDPQDLIATSYYYAIMIFLSGIYDYRSHWQHLDTPRLTTSAVQEYVAKILRITDVALCSTNLAGVLFFFPLRVAGARSKTAEQEQKILDMLRHISRKNFVVADAFVTDLEELWQSKDRPVHIL